MEALERRRKAAESAAGTYDYEAADVDAIMQQRLRRKRAVIDAAINDVSAKARRRHEVSAAQQSGKDALAAALTCTVRHGVSVSDCWFREV